MKNYIALTPGARRPGNFIAVTVFATLAVLIASSLVNVARTAPVVSAELQAVCTHEALQAHAPPGVTIKDIPDLNPFVSSVKKTENGVAYISEGLFGDGAPEYCLVTGSVITNPATGKTANFGAALPAPTAWSKRLLMQGCGGTCGDVFSNGPPAATLIRRGYTVWTTDDGHVDSGYADLNQPVSAGSAWMINRVGEPNADALVDYAYRAVHTVADMGKAFTRRVYGVQGIDQAYFLGCSDGGREALQEAMLYPEDFDGIVAGAPFVDPPGTVIAGIATQLAQFKSPESQIPAEAFDAVSKAILAKCDSADGTIDGIVQNPAACPFNPQRDIQRCDGASHDNSGCLTEPQINAVTAMLNAVRDTSGRVVAPAYATISTGRQDRAGFAAWAAFPKKPENSVGPFPFGPDLAREGIFSAWPLSDGMIRNLTFLGDPQYNSLSTLGMRFNQQEQAGDGSYSGVISAEVAERIQQSLQSFSFNNPYFLASFIARDKKLLMWHGYADGILTPYASVRFYKKLASLNGGFERLRNNVRLFMAPDVGHCGYGGAGPNALQTLYHNVPGELPPPVMDSEHDLLMALEQWVTAKSPPQQIIASRYQDDDPAKAVVRSMPLCPFPSMAHYAGTGDVNKATSWTCPLDDQALLTIGRLGTQAGF